MQNVKGMCSIRNKQEAIKHCVVNLFNIVLYIGMTQEKLKATFKMHPALFHMCTLQVHVQTTVLSHTFKCLSIKRYNYIGQKNDMQIGVLVRQTFLGGRNNLIS